MYDVVLLIGLLFVNGWFALFLCFIGVVLFQSYYECVFAGVMIDSLYGLSGITLMNIPLIFTAITFVLIVVGNKLKTNIF